MENKETYHVVQYGKKASRRDYSKVSSGLPLPDLTEIQTNSFEWFLKEGIREVGILDMQIYLRGNLLFMIVDTVDNFDWVKDNERLASLPRQKEWEEYMSRFQQADPHAASHEKWQMMERIFKL